MNANVEKHNGYGIVHSGGPGASVAMDRGYLIVSSTGTQRSSLIKFNGYQVLASPATNIKTNGYMVPWQGAQAPVIKCSGYQIWVPLFPPTFNFNVDYDFFEERFPDCISFSSSGGPGFSTNVTEFDSGIVSVDREWEKLRARYSVNFEVASPEEIQLVEDFFYVAKGRAVGFRFKDWQDYQIVLQNIGVGDGVTAEFPLFKRYQSGNTIYDRMISKPLEVSSNGDDMQITVDGVVQIVNGQVYVNESTGLISFTTPPAPGQIVRVDYGEFDVPVRFDTDTLDISFDEFRQLSLEVPLVEVRV